MTDKIKISSKFSLDLDDIAEKNEMKPDDIYEYLNSADLDLFIKLPGTFYKPTAVEFNEGSVKAIFELELMKLTKTFLDTDSNIGNENLIEIFTKSISIHLNIFKVELEPDEIEFAPAAEPT